MSKIYKHKKLFTLDSLTIVLKILVRKTLKIINV